MIAIKPILFLLLFGALGVLARYGSVQYFVGKNWTSFPLGTASVNIAGSFLIGLIAVVIREKGLLSEDWFAPLVAGFLGGFTTFSSFSWEVWNLLEKNEIFLGITYAVGAPVMGVLACIGGCYIGRIL